MTLTLFASQPVRAAQVQKPRVIVLTDGEVDDRCSMVRFLLYADEMDIAAIIQTNSVFQKEGWSKAKWLEKELNDYEKVYPNLIIHDKNYPTAAVLKKRVYVGDEDSTHLGVDHFVSKLVPGMKPVIDPANWKDTPGSDRIVAVLLESNPAKVYIQAWGGGNTAARAFYKLKTDHPADYQRAISKVVMYNIWYQDGAGSYIETNHPGVTMLISYNFAGSWAYGSQRYSAGFVSEYLHKGHGALATNYVQDFISEGDSPSFLYTLGAGLKGYENPTYGGWGGMFYKVDGFQNVYRDAHAGSYTRWIEQANRDFEARLRWCVAPKFADANHAPVIALQGNRYRTVKSGDSLTVKADVKELDPMDYDALWVKFKGLFEQLKIDRKSFEKIADKEYPSYTAQWWQYREAGTYEGYVNLTNKEGNAVSFKVPMVKEPQTIHLILEATDNGTPALTSYERVVVTVNPK